MAVESPPGLVETFMSPFTNFLRSWDYRPVTSWLSTSSRSTGTPAMRRSRNTSSARSVAMASNSPESSKPLTCSSANSISAGSRRNSNGSSFVSRTSRHRRRRPCTAPRSRGRTGDHVRRNRHPPRVLDTRSRGRFVADRGVDLTATARTSGTTPGLHCRTLSPWRRTRSTGLRSHERTPNPRCPEPDRRDRLAPAGRQLGRVRHQQGERLGRYLRTSRREQAGEGSREGGGFRPKVAMLALTDPTIYVFSATSTGAGR